MLNTNSTGTASITATPVLGVGSSATGKITFQNSTNNNTVTLQPGATASNLTWTLPATDSTGTQCLSSNGSGILGWLTCSGSSGAALSAITAATGSNTIASGNNTGQVWNWTNSTDSTTAFTLGETAAATNGTSTSGVPNQVLFKLSTAAASTQSPFKVAIRGTDAFWADPANAQLVINNGSVTNPSLRFAAGGTNGYGIYLGSGGGSTIAFAVGGSLAAQVGSAGLQVINGTFGNPSLQDTNTAAYGFVINSTSGFNGVSIAGLENSRWLANAYQLSRGSADATAFALNVRKSRGTVASPTVITTGDDLATFTGYGYVGGTNTYQDAAQIRFDSAGTISDATNGIGGEVVFATKKQGANTTVADRIKIDQAGHVVTIAGTGNTPSMGSCGTSPSVAGTDNAMLVTVGTGGSATSCAVNFGTAWATAPVCTAQNDDDKVAYSISTSTSAVTVAAAAAFTASSKFHIICFGI